MTRETKCRLINEDPTTVVRYFDHRFLQFFHVVVKSCHTPIYEVTDHFMRYEFAERGTIHVHWFAYLKDAPEYGKTDNETIANYYCKIISCSSDVPSAHKNILNIKFIDIQKLVM